MQSGRSPILPVPGYSSTTTVHYCTTSRHPGGLEVLLIAKIPDLSFSGASWCCCSHQTNKQRILVKFSHIYRKQPSGPSGGATIKPPGAVKFGVGAEL